MCSQRFDGTGSFTFKDLKVRKKQQERVGIGYISAFGSALDDEGTTFLLNVE
jgi:hypothetical protein